MSYIGSKCDLNSFSIEEIKSFYKELIKEIFIFKNNKIEDSEVNNAIIKTYNWLEQGDFYTAPASTGYHEAEQSGLLFHTMRVYNEMLDLIKLPKFRSVNIYSATLCCLVHDWCKISAYKSSTRNVKDENTGEWKKVDYYTYSDKKVFPFGHGAASMYTAMRLFDLNEQEALAIRWHMGAWRVVKEEAFELSEANKRFPLVHLIQFADQLSITDY